MRYPTLLSVQTIGTYNMDGTRLDAIWRSSGRLDSIDQRITHWMSQRGITVLRGAIAVIFIWFGGLKVINESPATGLVEQTVFFLPPEVFIPILGIWEVAIGLCFLYKPLIRVGIALLFLQMPGTFLPIVVLPGEVFTQFPYGLTMEGQYIFKNLAIIGAALVIGATVREKD